LVQLSRGEAINSESLIYLNRLSDFLFVAARWLAKTTGTAEQLWQQNIHSE